MPSTHNPHHRNSLTNCIQEYLLLPFLFITIRQMEAADRASLAQETLMQDESLAVRVATEVARALNLTVCVSS